MENGLIATFQCQENAETACDQLKNTLDYDGVTVISRSIKDDTGGVVRQETDPLEGFGKLANQMVETATRTGSLIGNVSGIAMLGLLSLPMLVAAPLMNNLMGGSPQKKTEPTQKKQLVTVSGNSDLKKAKDILINNGAKIYPH